MTTSIIYTVQHPYIMKVLSNLAPPFDKGYLIKIYRSPASWWNVNEVFLFESKKDTKTPTTTFPTHHGSWRSESDLQARERSGKQNDWGGGSLSLYMAELHIHKILNKIILYYRINGLRNIKMQGKLYKTNSFLYTKSREQRILPKGKTNAWVVIHRMTKYY